MRTMRHLRYWMAVVACVAALAVAGCGGGSGSKGGSAQSTSAPEEGFLPGKSAPAFTLTDLDGKPVSLADYKGKVVVVDFWATWCGPCNMEIPHLIELQKEFEPQGATILALSVDEDPPATVKQFVTEKGMNYPVVMADQDTQGKYGVTGYPTAYVIDKTGVIRNVFQGYTEQTTTQMASAIRSLL